MDGKSSGDDEFAAAAFVGTEKQSELKLLKAQKFTIRIHTISQRHNDHSHPWNGVMDTI